MNKLTTFSVDTHAGAETIRMERFQTLEPGTYWRARDDVKLQDQRWKGHHEIIKAGTVLLLTAVDVYDAAAHTIRLAAHPSTGTGSHRMLVHDFVNAFEYAPDGEAVREAEMRAIHETVASLQSELLEGQRNPTIMATAIADGLTKWEAEKQRELNRDAAKPGEAPASTALTIADARGSLRTDIGFVLENRLTTQDVVAMRLLAEREATRAELTANWLTKRTEAIADTLRSLSPYFSEKAQVALARTSSVRQYAADLMKGIASLDLYTGKGVEVHVIAKGESAPRDEKLHLRQAKLFADCEFAAWADVHADWDYSSLPDFDRALQSNPDLRDQILPKPRMVVAMATRRKAADYERLSAYEAARRDVQNKVTFLLVRDGENIYRIYSGEPTHEGTPRLFPSKAEIDDVFTGFDGSALTFRDLEFTTAVEDHDRLALHYKRLLILMCGLDHRLQLFGQFYDPAEALQFLSLVFQQRHFVFLADDEPGTLIGTARPDVQTFIKQRNAQLRSGSRVLCYFPDLLDVETAPACMRRDGDYTRRYAQPMEKSAELVAYKDGHELCVDVPVERITGSDARFNARISLTKAHPERGGESGVICLDGVKAEMLEWYVCNRQARIGYISYIRLFKQAAARLRIEEAVEAPARAYLRETIANAQITETANIDGVMDASIVAWRCAQRGKPLPALSDKAALHGILDLVWAQEMSGDLLARALKWVEENALSPLRVTLTGKSRLAVYAEVPMEERDNTVMDWGWVRRYSLALSKSGLQCTSDRYEWLTTKPMPSETTLREWPAITPWVHKTPESCKPRALAEAKAKVEDGIAQYREHFTTPGAGLEPAFLARALRTMRRYQLAGKHKMVGECNLSVPIGVYLQERANDVHELRLLGMHAPLMKWLQHFANPAQREEIERAFLSVFERPANWAHFVEAPFRPELCRLFPQGDALRISDDSLSTDTLITQNGRKYTDRWTSQPLPLSDFVANVKAGGTEQYRKQKQGAARVAFAEALEGLSTEALNAFFPPAQDRTEAGAA
ncbi:MULTISPECIES: hypothetical protein [Cupriavidus]